MLKFGMFHFRKSKNVDDINYVCQVEFLDDSEPLSITYQVSIFHVPAVCLSVCYKRLIL